MTTALRSPWSVQRSCSDRAAFTTTLFPAVVRRRRQIRPPKQRATKPTSGTSSSLRLMASISVFVPRMACSQAGKSSALPSPALLFATSASSCSTRPLQHSTVSPRRLVKKPLDEAAKCRTTIDVAHRLSITQKADCIHVLDQGIIIERGTPMELPRSQL